MTQIAAALTALIADTDAKVLADSLVRIEANYKRAREFFGSDEAQKLNVYARYDRVFALAGGKSWWKALSGRGVDDRASIITKSCKATAAKRNATIEAKLNKAGITEIEQAEVIYNRDGFDGIYKADGHRIMIRTIIAGGYNIQCLHCRVLVKIS